MTGRTRNPRPKGQSLTAAGKIKPQQWNLSKDEAAEALRAIGIPVKEIKKIRCLRHQVCLSYWDEAGNVCSSFFSYRRFAQWQQSVEVLIGNCQSIPAWEQLGDIIEYDLLQFPYTVEMGNAIWDALKRHWYQLKAAATERSAV